MRYIFLLFIVLLVRNSYSKVSNIDRLCSKYNTPDIDSSEPIEAEEYRVKDCRLNIYCFKDDFYSAKISLVCKKNEYYKFSSLKKGKKSFMNSVSANDESLLVTAVHIDQASKTLSGSLFKIRAGSVYDTIVSEVNNGFIHFFEVNGSDVPYLMKETSCDKYDLKIETLKKCFNKNMIVTISKKNED